MNNKGFTLIELLATIILLALIMTVTTTSVIGIMNKSKEESYKILIDNIKIGAQEYFEECENNKIIGTSITCPTFFEDGSNKKNMTTTLGELLIYGFLTSSATDDSNNKIVQNPKDNTDISNCEIIITKTIDGNNSVTYSVTVESSIGTCPANEDYAN